MTRTQKALITRLDGIGLPPLELTTVRDLLPRAVIRIAANWAGITIDDLLSRRLLSDVVARRWLVIYALRCRYMWLSSMGYSDWYNYCSFSSLSRLLEMHHTSIMHAILSTLDFMKTHKPELYDFYFAQSKDEKFGLD